MTRLRHCVASAGQAPGRQVVASAGQALGRQVVASAEQAPGRHVVASAEQAPGRHVVASATQAPVRHVQAEAGQVPARHFVTDRRRYGLSIDELVARAANAVRAGVDVIQVREPDLPDDQLVALVRRIGGLAAGSGTRVMVNDRADVAIAAGAAGVHLRGDSLPASRVRAMIPEGFLVGRSVHALAEVDAAIAGGGCDYLLFGTVFRSAGKPDGHPVAGLEALRAVCARSLLPVIAIGGINEENAALVREAGAAGFAAIGLFMCFTPHPEVV